MVRRKVVGHRASLVRFLREAYKWLSRHSELITETIKLILMILELLLDKYLW